MAAQLGLVEHVVVDERRGVDHLDDHAEQLVRTCQFADGFSHQQHQRRPQPLAAQAVTVPDDFIHKRVAAGKFGLEPVLDASQGRHDRPKQIVDPRR